MEQPIGVIVTGKQVKEHAPALLEVWKRKPNPLILNLQEAADLAAVEIISKLEGLQVFPLVRMLSAGA